MVSDNGALLTLVPARFPDHPRRGPSRPYHIPRRTHEPAQKVEANKKTRNAVHPKTAEEGPSRRKTPYNG